MFGRYIVKHIITIKILIVQEKTRKNKKMVELYTSKIIHKQKISIKYPLIVRSFLVAIVSFIIYSAIFAAILFNSLYHNL